MVFGKGALFSVIRKDLLNLCGYLHCFLKDSAIYSSIIQRKEVQRLIMKVASINACLLSSPVSFIIPMNLVNIVHFEISCYG